MDKVTIKSSSQHTNRLHQPSSVRYLLVTPSQQLNNYMFSATSMLKQRQLNILGQQTALTDRPRIKKNCWYEYEVLPMFKKISTNTFLWRKIAPTLGYIAALKTKFENKRMYSREKQSSPKPWRGRRGHCWRHEFAAIARQWGWRWRTK
jgi:hypothetical protein